VESKQEYKIFNDISTSEKRSNRVVLLSLGSMLITVVSCFYFNYKNVESSKNSFYVLDSGQKLSIVRIKNHQKAIDILCEGHLMIFHELFFDLSPDLEFIKKNIEEKALFMADHSVTRLYNRLIDRQYYEDIAQRGYSIELEQDSIAIDYSTYPFRFEFRGKQKIEKGKQTEYRNLITSGYIKETQSTSNNLNGLKIINFNVVDNSDLIK